MMLRRCSVVPPYVASNNPCSSRTSSAVSLMSRVWHCSAT
jgi:hypothetical protein